MTLSEFVIHVAATQVQLRSADLIGPARSRRYVRPRQRAMYALRQVRPDFSLSRIGEALGGRDHTTVMSAIGRVEARIGADPWEAETVEALITTVRDYAHNAALSILDLQIAGMEDRLRELRAQRAALLRGRR